jgi:sulfate adenylyltransferase subunit 1 (EFTu-like GTPase family)
MDRVDWSESSFQAVAAQVNALCTELGFATCQVIPVSALNGDNVVERSPNSTWYSGPSVLEALESTRPSGHLTQSQGARLPIQWVLRQNGGGRTYAGMVNGGTFRVGDTVTLLPAGVETTISKIHLGGSERSDAYAGLSVDLDLLAETDAGRGDLIASNPLPTVTKEFVATICWFSEKPMAPDQRLRLKHTTRVTPARVITLDGLIDIEHLSVGSSDVLAVNQIGLATIACADALVVDDYTINRATGSFVLIDEVSNATVAAGMIGRPSFL